MVSGLPRSSAPQCIGIGSCSLPVAVSEVTGEMVSVSACIISAKECAYLEMSRVAFSPTFMVVTPSSQPIVAVNYHALSPLYMGDIINYL